MTKRRINDFLTKFDGYISFSGGVDSTVLRDIALQIDPNIPIVFNYMGTQFQEVADFAKDRCTDVIAPDIGIKDVIRDYGCPVISKEQSQYIHQLLRADSQKTINKRWFGENGSYKISECWKDMFFSVEENKGDCYDAVVKENGKKYGIKYKAPFKVSDKCCKKLKIEPFLEYEKETGEKPIVGTMVEESRNRLNSYIRNGCNSFDGERPMSKPLSFWSKDHILQYIKDNKLDYCHKIYGDIVQNGKRYYTTKRDRTGCIFCGFGIHRESKPNRIQKLGETHPKLYDYCINYLGFGKVYDFMGIDYKVRPRLFKI